MSEREDYEGLANELEDEAGSLADRSRQLGENIGEVRDDWERKRADEAVPGAPPRSEDSDQSDAAPVAGAEDDHEDEERQEDRHDEHDEHEEQE